MNPRQNHNRTSSHGRKALPPHARPSKPPPLRRGVSHNHALSHSQNATCTNTHTHSKSTSKRASAGDVSQHVSLHVDDEESGMASFLQFWYVHGFRELQSVYDSCKACWTATPSIAWLTTVISATCERQIITPGTNILYCSESKDVSRPPSTQSLESARSPSVFTNASSYFEHPAADILPQRSPTRRPWSMSFDEMSSIDYALGDSPGHSTNRQSGEPNQYLGDFFHTTATQSNRPFMHRASTTDANLPSLVHSPSSSWGTVASHASYRPLASRQHPFTTDHHHTKSVDLVNPYPAAPLSPTHLLKDASLKSCASTLTSFRVAEAEALSYDRRTSSSSQAPERKSSHNRSYSVKQLFSHEAMKAPPKTPL